MNPKLIFEILKNLPAIISFVKEIFSIFKKKKKKPEVI